MGYKLFSVDDHLIEPPDLWTSRMPAKYQDDCLRVERHDGVEYWMYEDTRNPIFGLFATAGKPQEEWSMDPMPYGEMHPACYDGAARSVALRTDGCVGSVTFPTAAGFAGRTFIQGKDKDLALAGVRAYNDFMFDQWCAADPGLLVPTILAPLWDVDRSVEEIHRCAALGARSLSFLDNPYVIGLAPLNDPSWDPLWQALLETDVAISAHGGGSGRSFMATPQSHFMQAIVGSPALFGCEIISELMFSPVLQKFPDLRWIITEAGAGYVPYLLERADYHWEKQRAWHKWEQRPSDTFHRSMFVPLVNEQHAVENRHKIGVANLMWESDFPHPESFWPHSQEAAAKDLHGVPDDEAAAITHGNAARVFRWTVD